MADIHERMASFRVSHGRPPITRTIKRAALAAFTVTAVVATFVGLTATSASAINWVDCGPSDYTTVTWHDSQIPPVWKGDSCFAQGGEISLTDPDMHAWVTKISTGNNRVQWYGDGKWQPDQPIDKWTIFTWPHNPGGVSVDKIRIV